VWREATFTGNITAERWVRVATEDGELAEQRKSADGRTPVPATWTCVG
jgi:hypothetical protein